jgi:leucyl-tRNA synthetase
LRQWFLRASQFSKDLYDGLDDPSLQNWRDIIKIQKNWIGEPNGTNVDFKMADQNDVLTAWTDMPEFINEVAFIGVSSGHLLDRKELVVSRKFDILKRFFFQIFASCHEKNNTLTCLINEQAGKICFHLLHGFFTKVIIYI